MSRGGYVQGMWICPGHVGMSGMGGYVWGGWVLKLSGGHHTYGQQAGGTHPTECFLVTARK